MQFSLDPIVTIGFIVHSSHKRSEEPWVKRNLFGMLVQL